MIRLINDNYLNHRKLRSVRHYFSNLITNWLGYYISNYYNHSQTCSIEKSIDLNGGSKINVFDVIILKRRIFYN